MKAWHGKTLPLFFVLSKIGQSFIKHGQKNCHKVNDYGAFCSSCWYFCGFWHGAFSLVRKTCFSLQCMLRSGCRNSVGRGGEHKKLEVYRTIFSGIGRGKRYDNLDLLDLLLIFLRSCSYYLLTVLKQAVSFPGFTTVVDDFPSKQ